MTNDSPLSVLAKSVDDAPAPGFQDWATFISFQPRLYFRPASLDELSRFLLGIQHGLLPGKSPRVLGGLHSCSQICVSDTIIDTSDLPRTLDFDPGLSGVTVSANWHLHDFLEALGERGKSISATGGTDHQTLAGVISTDTAPASPHHLIYELVDWIEYLTLSEDGQVIVTVRARRGEPAFRAAVASLGAIGVLTRIHFRLIDQPYYETVQKVIPLPEALTDLEKTSRQYDFWRIDWIPDTDNGLLWAAKRVPSADPQGDYAEDASENILVTLFKLLDKIETAGPLLDDAMRLIYTGIAFAYGEAKASGPLRTMLPVDRRAPLKVAMAEWSFAPADLPRLLAACRRYYQAHGWPNLPIEIELTQTDDFYMSPWNWPGLPYIVKFNFMYLVDICETPAQKAGIVEHLRGLWDHLLAAGIPFKAHWGKLNFMDPAFVRTHFELDAFRPFTRPLFINPYLAERLG